MPTIYFPEEQIEISVASGEEIQDVFEKHPELPLRFGCRKGNCGICAIEVMDGDEHLSQKSEKEAEILTRIFHGISKGDGQDVALNSPTDIREHCQIDKARESGGEDGGIGCSASPGEREILGLKKKGISKKRCRLACQCAINGDVSIHSLFFKKQSI